MPHPLLDKILRTKHSPDFELLRQRLHRHHAATVETFHATHRHAKRLFSKHNLILENMRQGSTKAAAGAALASSLFVSPALTAPKKPVTQPAVAQAQIPTPPVVSVQGPQNPAVHKLSEPEFRDAIQGIMGQSFPREGNLTDSQFQQIQKLVKDNFGIDIDTKTKSGFEFKYQYGMTGAEQHLPTHPGDTAAAHTSPDDPLATLSGITSSRGAWGYVPSNPSDASANKEKWYVVGRTMDSPEFGTEATKNLGGQRYLTIQIPTAQNGYHVFVGVGELWDAGPGKYTGKVWGHSPEYWYKFGQQAGQSRKTEVIMLPVTSDMTDAQLGPQGFHN